MGLYEDLTTPEQRAAYEIEKSIPSVNAPPESSSFTSDNFLAGAAQFRNSYFDGFISKLAHVPEGFAQLLGADEEDEYNPLAEIIRQVETYAKAEFPLDLNRQDSIIQTVVPGIIGDISAQLLASYAGRAAGAAIGGAVGNVPGAVIGGAIGGYGTAGFIGSTNQIMYAREEAQARGITDEETLDKLNIPNALIGSTEALPTERMFKAIKALKGTKIAQELVKAGLANAIQGGFAQTATDVVANHTYEAGLSSGEIAKRAGTAALIEGIVGAGVTGSLGFVFRGRGGPKSEQDLALDKIRKDPIQWTAEKAEEFYHLGDIALGKDADKFHAYLIEEKGIKDSGMLSSVDYAKEIVLFKEKITAERAGKKVKSEGIVRPVQEKRPKVLDRFVNKLFELSRPGPAEQDAVFGDLMNEVHRIAKDVDANMANLALRQAGQAVIPFDAKKPGKYLSLSGKFPIGFFPPGTTKKRERRFLQMMRREDREFKQVPVSKMDKNELAIFIGQGLRDADENIHRHTQNGSREFFRNGRSSLDEMIAERKHLVEFAKKNGVEAKAKSVYDGINNAYAQLDVDSTASGVIRGHESGYQEREVMAFKSGAKARGGSQASAREGRVASPSDESFVRSRVKADEFSSSTDMGEGNDYNLNTLETLTEHIRKTRRAIAYSNYLRVIGENTDIRPALAMEALRINSEEAVRVDRNVREIRGSAPIGHKAGETGSEYLINHMENGMDANLLQAITDDADLNRALAERYVNGALPDEANETAQAIIPRIPVEEKLAQFDKEIADGVEALAGKGYELPPEFEHTWFGCQKLSAIAANDADPKTRIAALEMLGTLGKRTALLKSVLGTKYVSPESFAHKWGSEYTEFRIDYKSMRRMAGTDNERVFLMAEESSLNELVDIFGIAKEDMHETKNRVMMENGIKTMIVPNAVHASLGKFGEIDPGHSFSQTLGKATGWWKVRMLFAPDKIIGYSARNITGDVDGSFAALPTTLLPKVPGQLHKAFGQMKQYLDPIGHPDADTLSASALSALDASQLSAETKILIANSRTIADLFKGHLGETELKKWMMKPFRFYGKNVMYLNNFREGVLRLAMFNMAKDGFNGKGKKFYGASRPAAVDQIHRTLGADHAAGRVSRDALGDYGNLSVLGGWLRESGVSPFFAWAEVNARRYPQLIKNAFMDFRTGEEGGAKGLAKAVSAGTITAISAMARIGAITALMHYANKIFFPEAEKRLSDFDRNNAHITLRENEDGSVMMLRSTGAFADFLDWFGAHDLISLLPAMSKGQITEKEMIEKMIQAPMNKFIGGIGPLFKLPYEVAFKQTLFPDATNPRPAKRGDIIAAALGFTDLARALASDGTTVRPHYLQRLIGVSDTRQSALFKVYDLKDRFIKMEGLPEQGDSNRVSIFKPVREAAYYDDYESFKKAKNAYIKKGGTRKRFRSSLKYLDPLESFSSKNKRKFLESLDSIDANYVSVARVAGQDLKLKLNAWWYESEKP